MQYDNLPVPRPPKTRKIEIFNTHNYEYIDNHVKQVNSALLLRNLRSLVTHLTQPAQNDVGKLRALFLWLSSVDMTSLQRPSVVPPVESAIGFLFRIKERKSNHATMFQALCREAKIPCIKVSGISKNSRYQVGSELDPARMRSQWNAVVIDGQWRLVDVLWASMAVIKKNPKEWSVQETSREVNNDLPTEEEEEDVELETTEHKINEFFFMTDPEAFIYTHLPDDSKWQFLGKKVTLKEFEMLPYLRERFFDMGLSLSDDSHPRCILETVDQEVYLQFSLDPDRSELTEFRYLLHRAKSSKLKNTDVNENVTSNNKMNLDKAVSLTKYPDELRLNLHLPVVSRYRLDIFGREDRNPNCNNFDIVCSYVIDYQQASMAYLEVHFLFPVPSDHARFLRRGGASDWLKRKDAALKVMGNELIISFAMPAGPANAKKLLLDFENRHQVVPPAIRSLLHIVPKEFDLVEAHDTQNGRKEWRVGKIHITFLGHINGLVRTADGKVDICMNVDTDTEIWYEFHEDNHTKGVPKEAVKLISEQEKDYINLSFKLALKKPMDYLLNVFGRNRAHLNKFFHVKTYCVQYELLDFV